jgi:acetone carboxylase gamma subunit
MDVTITEYLAVDLDKELWKCRSCGHLLGSAREDYKHGLLVHARNPAEIHKPMLDPKKYAYTYCPDPEWCAMLEFYCPHCGAMMEVEYTVPGHPPICDIELDLDDLKRKWLKWQAEGKDIAPAMLTNAPKDTMPAACGHNHGTRGKA